MRILARWVQLAALATALSLMVYLSAQQIGRHLANDPQVQLARDAKAAYMAGAPVDSIVPKTNIAIERSLSPFITAFDVDGKPIASSGRLHGRLATIPSGVIDNVRQDGEERVTWQPEPGVRVATVVESAPGNPHIFILAGRSLRETEERIRSIGNLLLLLWGVTCVALLVVVAATEPFLQKAQ